MRAAEIVWAWVAGFAIVLAFTVAVLPAGARPRFDGAPVVVVGSSLMLNAVPPAGSGQHSLLGDGRSHRRFAVSAASEKDVLALLGHALDERASVVLLEVNPLIRDFQFGPSASCGDWLTSLGATIKEERRKIARATKLAIGWGAPEAAMEEARGLDERRTYTQRQIAYSYPLRLREPTCRPELERLVAGARRQGTQLVLVLPPRSAQAHAVLGESQALELEGRARRLADALGARLFDAGSPWPDQEFADHAHLGSSGRARFLRELRHWWVRPA